MEPKPRQYILFAAAWTGALALYLAFFPGLYMHRSWALWRAKAALLAEPGPARTLVLGDSRAMFGIVPELLPTPAVSLALEGTSPLEAYYLFRSYLERHPAPELVIFSVSPIRLMRDEYFWRNTAKMGGLGLSGLSEALREARRLGDTEFTAVSSRGCFLCEWFRLGALELRWPFLYQPEVAFGGLFLRARENAGTERAMVEARGAAVLEPDPRKAQKPGREANQVNFEPSPVLASYFDRILRLAGERNVPVRFAFVPTNPVSAETVAPRFRADFVAFLRQRERAARGFRLLDEPLTYEERFFADQDHLTREGAERYTFDLLKKLAPGMSPALSASPVGD